MRKLPFYMRRFNEAYNNFKVTISCVVKIAAFPTSKITTRDSKNQLKVCMIKEGTQSEENHFCRNCDCTLQTMK